MEPVDLGLSVKWADCNIGAKNPSDKGKFFAFGEVVPRDLFTIKNYKTRPILEPFESQIAESKYSILKLSLTQDAANVILGKKWRMPTRFEVEELIQVCEHDIFKFDGVFGTKVVSPNGASIFLPCTGRKVDGLLLDDRRLYYWLSTSLGSGDADGLGGDRGWLKWYWSYRWYIGRCIRPVMDI